ncbi:MAG: HutD family protein [Myxococcota bacterium]
MQRIARAQWQRQPWKNGGGITHEIWRDGDGPHGFALRLSAAEVVSDGPFSRFPGIDRTILLLDGRGFHLQRDEGPASASHAVDQVGVPFAFRGEAARQCRLVDGPVLDLNLMVDRDRARAEPVGRSRRSARRGRARRASWPSRWATTSC